MASFHKTLAKTEDIDNILGLQIFLKTLHEIPKNGLNCFLGSKITNLPHLRGSVKNDKKIKVDNELPVGVLKMSKRR